jgi:aryl-alcohol dehydrogenase-like predicted oxidoreductase
MIGGNHEQRAMALAFLLTQPFVNRAQRIIGVPKRCQVTVVVAAVRVLVSITESDKEKLRAMRS